MSTTFKNSKQNLRKSMLELRNKQPHDLMLQKSHQIIKQLMDLKEYKIAKVVMLYSGKESEVRTDQLIRTALEEKRVTLPITNKEKRILEISEIKDYDLELETATFNILEPKKEYYRRVDIDIIDLIVVPGICFDCRGHRLGYGFGYYDKLLTIVNRPIPFIGLAFQFQIHDVLPNSDTDIPVHLIVTEEQIIHCCDYKMSS
ncbi:MAG TPA: 5-formyltetrahydrofolate cyclo-ligase [Candidatus Deferrimicrobium sp.]|nr:5-formyltetrahydrofolate cyclo-ligase [Candidatus Deferrimicrobium sp.]